MKTHNILFPFIVSLAVASCSERISPDSSDTLAAARGEMLIMPLSSASTKGYVTQTTLFDSPYDALHSTGAASSPRELSISSFLFPQSGEERNYFTGENFRRDDDGFWHHYNEQGIKEPIYWPIGGTLDFLAVSSSAPLGDALSWNELNGASQAVVNVTSASRQDDIVFSSVVGRKVSNGSTVDMTFRHSQAWIEMQLNASVDGILTVKKVELEDVFMDGVLTIDNGNGNPSSVWSFREQKAAAFPMDDYCHILNTPLVRRTGTMGGADDTVGYMDMLIPEQEKTAIVITYSLKGYDRDMKYRIELDNDRWLAGKRYTYAVNFEVNEMEVNPTVQQFEAVLENLALRSTFSVSQPSRYTHTIGTVSKTVRVNTKSPSDDWEITGFAIDGTWKTKAYETWTMSKPSWLKISDYTGTGSMNINIGVIADGEPKAVKIRFTSGREDRVIEIVNSAEDSRARRDLSRYDFMTNTTSARQFTANCYVIREIGEYMFPLVYGNAIEDGVANTSAYPAGFVDHADRQIFSPYIVNQTGIEEGSLSADLLWEDNAGAITALEIVDGYIHFACNKLETNAVIAVKSAGTTLWSWHIWATGLDLQEVVITNSQGVDHIILNYNVGQTATSGNKSMLFQWGRKDPFRYDGTVTTIEGGKTRGYSIQNADKFITKSSSPYDWCSTTFNNSWDADNTSTSVDSPVVKTIYDPSPVGYSVPRYNTFTYFSTTNIVGSFNQGYTFKRNSSDTQGVFFPASGYRSYSGGSAISLGSDGGYWLSVIYSSDRGRNLSFDSGDVRPQYNNRRASGFAVRPARL